MLGNTVDGFPGIGKLYCARTPRKPHYTARLVLVTGVQVARDGFAGIEAARAWGREVVAEIEAAQEAA